MEYRGHGGGNQRGRHPRDDDRNNGGRHGHHQYGQNYDRGRERGNVHRYHPGNNDQRSHQHEQRHRNLEGDRGARANYSQGGGGAKRTGGYHRSGNQEQHGSRGNGEDGNSSSNNNHDSKRYKTEEPENYTHSGNDLTPEAKEYMEKFKRCLRFGEVYGIPFQAFSPEHSDQDRQDAAQYALDQATQRRTEQRESAAKQQSGGYQSESSDSEGDLPGNCSKDEFALISSEKKFFMHLKDCLPLTTGFDIQGSTEIRHCYCPCSIDMKPWRDQDPAVNNLFDKKNWKGSSCKKTFQPSGLMQHLEKEGERCILHFGAMKYLENLYANFNGSGIGHKDLYKMGDTRYRKADAQQTRTFQNIIQVGQRALAKEKEERAKEKEKRLEAEKVNEVNEDLFKRMQMLKENFALMGVEKKQKREIMESELSSYRLVMRLYISSLRKEHVKTKSAKVCMIVHSSPPSSNTSFSLQEFFDDYYDQNESLKILVQKPQARTKAAENAAVAAVEKTHDILFGEDDKAGLIAHAMLSTWNITFKESADQDADTIAVDEGGPLRQFKTDCWKQLNALSIKVGEKKLVVRLFEDGEGGIIPVPDDNLRYFMRACEKEEVEGAIQRAQAYARAIGRIMFNSFQDFENHTVSRSAMLPIFANLILRGCIPGDDNYERGDILNHIVPLAPNPLNNVIKHHIGEKIDEGDDKSEIWTPDSVFRQLIPDKFIRSRKILLSGLEAGLSVGGRPKPSSLEKGASLAEVFRAVPLEALDKILFAKSAMTIEEVLAVLEPDYCQCEGMWEGSADDMVVQQKKQEMFFDGHFKKYLTEEACKRSDFVEDFVQFCTGSNYLPLALQGEKPFKITVEFNFTNPEPGCVPMAHTCVNTIRLPGMGMYGGNYDLLRDQMNEAMACCNVFGFK